MSSRLPPQSRTKNTLFFSTEYSPRISDGELLSKLIAVCSPGCIPWGSESLGSASPRKQNVSLLNFNEFELLIPLQFENLDNMCLCTVRSVPNTATFDRVCFSITKYTLIKTNTAHGPRLILMHFLLWKKRGRRRFQESSTFCPNIFGNGRIPLST